MSNESPTYDDIMKIAEALDNAKVPTKDRYGYTVMDDGSVEMFAPTKPE